MPEQPEMMAIGDSLFNGVRSLTINEPLAQWSAPAQVANALGIPFATPDYPRNVVTNFEQWLRDFPNLAGIALDVENNINFWDTNPKSSLAAFDNIAIASTTYADMYSRTWQTAQTEINDLHGRLGTDFSKIGGNLAALFFAFNTRFLLNPTGDPQAPALTPLGIVAERRPARLLISIGANNGLWNMGFAADASTGQPGGPIGDPFDQQDMSDLNKFFDELRALPADVKHIYLNALPLPSQVADMMPVPDVSDDPSAKPGPGNYYAHYENRFGFNYNVLTGAQVKANDALVTAVNARVRAEAATDPRIHVVPIDAAFAQYDFKTNKDARTIPTTDGKTISNIMIEGPELLFPNFWRGGLMGLDGMHPTVVGYAIMSTQILQAIDTYEGIKPVAMPTMDAAYKADSLLQKVPISWDIVLDLSLDIRRSTGARPAGMKYDAVADLLNALGFKYD